GALPEALRARVEEHLASCADCAHEDAADAELSTLLDRRLARPRAPDGLRRGLEARWGRPRRAANLAALGRTAAAMAAGAALAVVAMTAWRAREPDARMTAEAVNDHLRVLYSERPLGVESGGIHQVKPWFEGRLDFAPIVPFESDDEFTLQGGAVGYFLDRKAATFVYKRRLHLITLFVFPAAGLSWPAIETIPLGAARASLVTSRGFHVLLWRAGDLGYALVSDIDERELTSLGGRIAK
ncbi:MAG TPA: zf-HC2 domain-containing protein, partial [Polyangiaceae bacterium]|nr:zf-HC2 domain-containing protein [Polyangiaceae bacterium]